MAKQSFQLDPEAGGVSLTTFNNHTHGYDKMTSCNKMSFCDPLSYTQTPTETPST